jgi:hypothetical protein
VTLEPLVTLLAISGLLLSPLALRIAFSRNRRINRTLRRLATTPIAQVRDGRVVKIAGELVSAGRTVLSGMSKKECLYYTLVVEGRRFDGRRRSWQELVRQEEGADFYVKDATGIALVRLGGGQSTFAALIADRKARTSKLFFEDKELERFMARRSHTNIKRWRRSLRAYEGILAPGERVVVGGLARWLPDPDSAAGSYREAGMVLVLEASESVPLFLSDDPKLL